MKGVKPHVIHVCQGTRSRCIEDNMSDKATLHERPDKEKHPNKQHQMQAQWSRTCRAEPRLIVVQNVNVFVARGAVQEGNVVHTLDCLRSRWVRTQNGDWFLGSGSVTCVVRDLIVAVGGFIGDRGVLPVSVVSHNTHRMKS